MEPDDWVRQHAGTPLRELVEGLDTVTEIPIPYARMPTRAHTVFGAEFSTWGQIADETVECLLERRFGGSATIVALARAAEDTVARYQAPAAAARVGANAAIQRLLDELGDRDRVMLLGRVWGPQLRTHQEVGNQLGTNATWVSRHLPRAQALFAELLIDPAHWEVGECANDLRVRLGPYVAPESMTAELRRLGVEQHSEPARVLLHLAGPYASVGAWFEAPGGQQRAVDAVADVFHRRGAPPAAEVHQALEDLGMAPGSVAAYVSSHLEVRWIGDRLVRWGDTAAVRAEAVLHARGTPASLDEIHAAIGDVRMSEDALRELLVHEDPFIRTSRRMWGLQRWGVEEYFGIAEAIGTRIDRAGGRIGVADLLADMQASFSDIAESSIRSYMAALAFVTKDGMIRRRRRSDPWPPVGPLNSVRGAFTNGDNEIRVTFPVNRDVLRGSGLGLPAAAAANIGVQPSTRREFTGPHGNVRVMWPLSSTHGARVGSLRMIATAMSSNLGDTLVLAFNPDAGTVEAIGIPADAPPVERLRRHIGRRKITAAALSAALDCPPADIEAVLRKRGDDHLADVAAKVLATA